MNPAKLIIEQARRDTPTHLFRDHRPVQVDDAWSRELEELPSPRSPAQAEIASSVVKTVRLTHATTQQSLDHYSGCEHGCACCFAPSDQRGAKTFQGIDCERPLSYKVNAPDLLEKHFQSPAYEVQAIALGLSTDPYQPIESKLKLTRKLLALMLDYRHPVSILTNGVTLLRDLDLLEALAEQNLVAVTVSISTLNQDLKRRMEPGAASPRTRLNMLSRLRDIGIEPGVMVAPIIPAINDGELETILARAAGAGAKHAGYAIMRRPKEIHTGFSAWLKAHYPDRARLVIDLLEKMDKEQSNARVEQRQTGPGMFTDRLSTRFRISSDHNGLSPRQSECLNLRDFTRPIKGPRQFDLV